jgi:FKBP-type peptidyl-prolyl isomerase-like protein
MLIDLGRRESIAGLRYGIPGMRVGGAREIVISPHLAYGEVGIPGRIPANALLRCEVELLEIRKTDALLPQDWLPGKILILRRSQDANDQRPGWTFTVHEGGNSCLSFLQEVLVLGKQKGQVRLSQVPIPLRAEESLGLIRQAMNFQKQAPEECISWDSGFIDMQKGGAVIKDSRDGTRCMVIHVLESGKDVCLIGVHEDSLEFLGCELYRTIEWLIEPYICNNPGSF